MPDANDHTGQLPYHIVDHWGHPQIIWLDPEAHDLITSMDDDERRSNDEWYRHIDMLSESQKQYCEDANSDYSVDPIENIPSPETEPEYIIFEKEDLDKKEEENAKRRGLELKVITDAIAELQQQQQKLLKDRESMTQQQIAERDGITQQGVSNRETKIKKRVEKYLSNQGFDSNYYSTYNR